MQGEQHGPGPEEWEREQAARAAFPWFGDGSPGAAQPESPWLDTPASRAADEAAVRELQTEGLSREAAEAAVDDRRDRQRFERALDLGVTEEDATAA